MTSDHALAQADTSAGAWDGCLMYFVNSWVLGWFRNQWSWMKLSVCQLHCNLYCILSLPINIPLLHYCYLPYCYLLLLFLLLHCYYIIIMYYYTISSYYYCFCYYTVIASLFLIITYSLSPIIKTSLLEIITSLSHYYFIIPNHRNM